MARGPTPELNASHLLYEAEMNSQNPVLVHVYVCLSACRQTDRQQAGDGRQLDGQTDRQTGDGGRTDR